MERYELKNTDKYIINTGFDLDIETFYPSVYYHLNQFRNELVKRGDQGRVWYNLRACSYYDNFEKPKIIWQEMTPTPRFYFDTQNFYALNTSYILNYQDPTYLYYLLSVLNSRWSHLFFRDYASGGGLGDEGLRYIKTYIQRIAISVASKTEQNSLAQKAKDLLNLVKIENNQRVADGSHLGDFGFGPKVRNVILDKSHRSVSELEKIARQSRLNSKRKAEFLAWWALEQVKLEKLAKQIDKLDKAIDGEVARLYGLTAEDIFALERA